MRKKLSQSQVPCSSSGDQIFGIFPQFDQDSLIAPRLKRAGGDKMVKPHATKLPSEPLELGARPS